MTKDVKEDFKTRREENAKKKAAAIAKQTTGHQAEKAGGTAAERDQGEGDKAKPQPRTQSQNRQVRTPERQSSMHSQHNGRPVDKVRSPTNDSNKSGDSDGKRSTHSSPRKAR